jgi:hypothetical protein
MAIVPLKECNIPTLMPSPLAAVEALGEAEEDAEPEGEAVVVVVVGVQAFNKILPAAVEPRIKISRRRNCLAISLHHFLEF